MPSASIAGKLTTCGLVNSSFVFAGSKCAALVVQPTLKVRVWRHDANVLPWWLKVRVWRHDKPHVLASSHKGEGGGDIVGRHVMLRFFYPLHCIPRLNCLYGSAAIGSGCKTCAHLPKWESQGVMVPEQGNHTLPTDDRSTS